MPSDPLAGQNIVILGLARQGIALAKWLVQNEASVTVSDSRSRDQLAGVLDELKDLPVAYALGEHPPSLLANCGLLCLSGGVPPDLPIVQAAVARGIKLSNDAQIFVDRCPAHVIGITGSAGKTTTTSLVGAMVEAGGVLPWVGGNIGNPLISDLEYIRADDLVVMELSSFQLELMTTSPHIAAILNITPNHLDRHKTMEDYIRAKANIIAYQMAGDIAVLGYDDPHTLALRGLVKSGDPVFFSGRVPQDVGAWLVADRLVCRPRFELPLETVCVVSEIPLRGYHNVLNVLAACAIAGAAGIPVSAMREAILRFKAVEHRLEVVRVVDGVTYVNDSIATAPERVIAAVEAYPNEKIVLLLGGRDKKLPWETLAKMAAQRCRAVITFGEAGMMIAEHIARARAEAGVDLPLEQASSMAEVVRLASNYAVDGDVVLLSPGCTSFDAYPDFEARGKAFREQVMAL